MSCNKYSQGLPRHAGMLLWGSFQLINFFILINLLIAMMNSTIQTIQDNQQNECKFNRTKIWLSYCDIRHSVPPPLNIFEMLLQAAKKVCRQNVEEARNGGRMEQENR